MNRKKKIIFWKKKLKKFKKLKATVDTLKRNRTRLQRLIKHWKRQRR